MSFPAHYEVAAARQHRWARGDWQLLPWIMGHAPDTSGGRTRTPIPPISRWKMLDNLRRTLSAPAAVLTLIAGWTLPFASPVIWTMFVLATIAIPASFALPDRADPASPRDFETQPRACGRYGPGLAASHVALAVTLLAHQAWLMTDAIVRTLCRVYVTRRKLLEWVTAAQAKAGSDHTLGRVYHRMGGAVALAAVGRHPRGVRTAGSLAGCGAVRAALGAVTPGGTLDQPATARGWGCSHFRQMTRARCG